MHIFFYGGRQRRSLSSLEELSVSTVSRVKKESTALHINKTPKAVTVKESHSGLNPMEFTLRGQSSARALRDH